MDSLLMRVTDLFKEGIWWGFVGLGVWTAWAQGWLPFFPPPPRPRSSYDPSSGDGQAASGSGPRGMGGMSLQPRPDQGADKAGQSSGASDGADASQDAESEELQAAAVKLLTERAQQHATAMNHGKLTIDHMVLALAENPRFAEILQCAEGLTQDQIKTAIRKARVLYNRGEPEEELIPEVQTALSRYARDLTAAAREGQLDPLVGRAEEMRRVIHILCRRSKNNPVILGEPGVGKTALVEGLAARVAAGDVPEPLQGVTIMALDMGLLMAGAMMPGEFEERLKGILKELTATGTKYVLFIDDLHNVTGPNAQQGGGVMDASVLLKPLLGRGELRCIGATSLDKYKKFIEKDPALERRFQQVIIQPPTVPDTVSVLRGLRAKLERHHAVRITDLALQSAATLSARYITDRHLPDKALDLVDEAAARVRVDMSLKPELLDKVERRVAALEAERRLLRRSAPTSKADALTLEGVEEELASLRSQRNVMYERYQVERSQGEKLVAIQAEIDKLTDSIEASEEPAAAPAPKADTKPSESTSSTQPASSSTGAAAATATPEEPAPKPMSPAEVAEAIGKRTDLVKQMRALQESWLAKSEGSSDGKGAGKGQRRRAVQAPVAPRGEVGEADIARVISDWTGIPLAKLVEAEVDKVLHLAEELHRRIIGQEEAVTAVAEAIQRSQAGMKDPNGPIASFLFLGPTGVGKTELAKALAVALFNAEDAMIRLDMSEFMEKHAVSKLIGAPPGYVGFDEGGQLTEKVRHKPYSVILFDEVEKAHVDVFNVLLQILDDGRVTDGQGRLVSFKNCLIIMTSNLGSQDIYRHTAARGGQPAPPSDKEKIKELVMEQVRRHFKPEFINRVDEFIIFEPLKADQMEHIVSLRLKGVVSRLLEKRVRMVVSPVAMTYLAEKGFDPIFGGRPVRRVIQRELETPLARALLRNDFMEDDAVVVGLEQGETEPQLCFRRVSGGATSAGAAALQAEVASLQEAGTKVRAAGAANGVSASAPADNTSKASKGSAQLSGMSARPLKFDPLSQVSKAARQGQDTEKDGALARADPDSLPTDAGS